MTAEPLELFGARQAQGTKAAAMLEANIAPNPESKVHPPSQNQQENDMTRARKHSGVRRGSGRPDSARRASLCGKLGLLEAVAGPPEGLELCDLPHRSYHSGFIKVDGTQMQGPFTSSLQ